jgi:hypothetical protein
LELNKHIAITLEGKSPELKKVMLNVRKQVLRYEKAKKAGTLKKTDRVVTLYSAL